MMIAVIGTRTYHHNLFRHYAAGYEDCVVLCTKETMQERIEEHSERMLSIKAPNISDLPQDFIEPEVKTPTWSPGFGAPVKRKGKLKW